MIREIHAKTLLSPVKQPDGWFGLRYNMNLYRGCQHRCIYCDSRSLCYQIDHFDRDVLVKVNAPDLLRDELPRKRIKGVIGTGSMNDPYMPVERQYQLTRQALEIIAAQGFPVHIITKSDLVLRDLDLLREVNRELALVSFTLTTVDDALAQKVEPGAPSPSRRLDAMRTLAANGIHTGVTLMPLLPFIQDTCENITGIVTRAADCGASYILPAFGMTLRDRQRAYYYTQLDAHFPGLRQRYIRQFGDSYSCPANDAPRLYAHFHALCDRHNIARAVPHYAPQTPSFTQPLLL